MDSATYRTVTLSDGDLNAALDITRRISGPRTLDLGGGILFLSKPIELDARDSDLTITGTARLLAAKPIPVWTEEPDGLLSCLVQEGLCPTELIVDDVPRPLAVYPLEGHLRSVDKCSLFWRNSENGGWNRPPTEEELTRLTVDPISLPEGFNPEGALVTVFHQWDESTVEVSSLDLQTGVLRLASPMEHPSGAFGRNEFVFRGVRQGMSSPGVWCWDRTCSRVYYHPLPGERNPRAFFSTFPSLFLIRGASRVTIDGLTLTYSSAMRTRCGLRGSLASGAVDATDAPELTLRNLSIVSPGGSGIRLCRCPDARVLGCRIENAGVCGISAADCFPAEYRENVILKAGRLSGCAVGIAAGGRSVLQYVLDGRPEEAGGTVIAGNEISGSPYCGIALGGGPHLVERNRLSDCMRVLRDGAAIYCSRGEGTVIRENKATAALEGELSYAWYLDEWSENCIVERNQSDGFSIPFQFHRAKHCEICGNTSRSSGDLTVRATVCKDLFFRGNRFSALGNLVLQQNRGEEDPPLENPFRWENNRFDAAACILRTRIWRRDGTITLSDEKIDPPPGLDRMTSSEIRSE